MAAKSLSPCSNTNRSAWDSSPMRGDFIRPLATRSRSMEVGRGWWNFWGDQISMNKFRFLPQIFEPKLVLLQSHSSLPSTCSSDFFAVLWRNRFVYIYRIGFVQGKIWDHPWINRSQNLGVGSSCEPSFPKVYCERLVNSRLHNGDDRLGNKFVRAHKWGRKSDESLWTHNPSPQYGKAQASEISDTFCLLLT